MARVMSAMGAPSRALNRWHVWLGSATICHATNVSRWHWFMRLMKRRHLTHFLTCISIETYTVGKLWLWASSRVLNRRHVLIGTAPIFKGEAFYFCVPCREVVAATACRRARVWGRRQQKRRQVNRIYMYMYMYVYMHIHICMCICIYTYIYMHMCI